MSNTDKLIALLISSEFLTYKTAGKSALEIEHECVVALHPLLLEGIEWTRVAAAMTPNQQSNRLVELTDDICHVLVCFEQMGASVEELEKECQRLIQDSKYCDSWLKATGFFAA